MKVTEQIDAMRALGTDPIQKLVTPRLGGDLFHAAAAHRDPRISWACFGGWVIAIVKLHLTSRLYWTSSWQALEWNDVAQGLIKPLVFAVVVSLIGCFYGLRASGGTQGVGRATTQAMVAATIMILHHRRDDHGNVCQPGCKLMAETGSPSVLRFENVTVSFDGEAVLRDVSFEAFEVRIQSDPGRGPAAQDGAV